MHFLIDTNILIYRLKNMGNVNENFLKYQDNPMSILVISYGELLFGAEKSQAVEKDLATVQRIKSIFPLFDIISEIMEVYAKTKAYMQKMGKTTDDMDLLIASIAIANNLILVTHNTKHFNIFLSCNSLIGFDMR